MTPDNAVPEEDNEAWFRRLVRVTEDYFRLAANAILAVIAFGALFTIRDAIWWVPYVGGALTLVILGFAGIDVFIEIRRRRQLKELTEYSIPPPQSGTDKFMLRPREKDDGSFARPDRFEETLLAWFQLHFNEQVLQLTGDSGVGKSSLIFAYLLPRLATEEEPWEALSIRSFKAPEVRLREELIKLLKRIGRAPRVPDKHTLAELATRAAMSLTSSKTKRQRLLIVFDQFEEIAFLQEGENRSATAIAEFLEYFRSPDAPRNAAVLLSYRFDHKLLLEKLGLVSPLREGEDWLEVPRFRAIDARVFFEDNLGRNETETADRSKLIEMLVAEAQQHEETRGMVRPIILNMVGVCLGRWDAFTLSREDRGNLLIRYIRESLDTGVEGIYGRTIADQLLAKDRATRRPRTAVDLATATGLGTAEVLGTLRRWHQHKLVRPLPVPDGEKVGEVWEWSHDFVARLAGRILSLARRRLWWHRVLALTPVGAIILIGIIVFTVYIGGPDRDKAALANMNLRFIESETGEGPTLDTFEGNCSRVNWPELTGILQRNPQFRMLNLSGCNELTDIALAHFAGLDTIQSLNLSGCSQITNDGLKNLDGMKSLQSLSLGYCDQISDAGLYHLDGLTGLQSIDLSDCEMVTDAGLEHLSRLTALRTLGLGGSRITGAGLEHLRGLTMLQSLSLEGCQHFADGGLAHLGSFRELISLSLSNCALITDVGLQRLGGLTALLSLNLEFCANVTDVGLGHLSGLTALQSLDLSGCDKITDAGLGHLSGLTALQSLDLSGCDKITDAGLERLGDLISLESLNIWGRSKITDAGRERLKEKLPNLQITE